MDGAMLEGNSEISDLEEHYNYWSLLYVLYSEGTGLDPEAKRRDLLVVDQDSNTLLHELAERKQFNEDFATILIREIDINLANKNGDTAFHIAVQNKNVKLVKFLLETASERINYNYQNKEGNTILHESCKVKNYELINIISEISNIDPAIENNQGSKASDINQAAISYIPNPIAHNPYSPTTEMREGDDLNRAAASSHDM